MAIAYDLQDRRTPPTHIGSPHGRSPESKGQSAASKTIVNPWTAKITRSWHASLEGLLECGSLLVAAKNALPHGEFLNMIERDLPFGPRTAQMLMRVATDQRLTNANHVSHLPPHLGTLHELTKLNDEIFERGLADGTIHPDMGRAVATGLNRKAYMTSTCQLELFEPAKFLLTGTGRKLEQALKRHVYAPAKLSKNSETIVQLVVETIRNLEMLVSGIGEPTGVEKIQAEFDRLEGRVNRLMGPSRVRC
jgi:hypothetical protein